MADAIGGRSPNCAFGARGTRSTGSLVDPPATSRVVAPPPSAWRPTRLIGRGSVTLRIVVNAPSIHAASSISVGMAAKKPCRIHTANVKLKALLTRISPSRG